MWPFTHLTSNDLYLTVKYTTSLHWRFSNYINLVIILHISGFYLILKRPTTCTYKIKKKWAVYTVRCSGYINVEHLLHKSIFKLLQNKKYIWAYHSRIWFSTKLNSTSGLLFNCKGSTCRNALSIITEFETLGLIVFFWYAQRTRIFSEKNNQKRHSWIVLKK